MKRHINLTKFTCFVLLIAMIASVLVAGTYAKYTSSASGTNATVVATWSFQVNGEEIAVVGAPKTIAFGLFDTINDSDGVNAETDVSTDLIAPGTSGSFEFLLQNTSDVTAQYGIAFTVTNEHDIPIEFSLDGVNWSYELTDIDLSSNTILPIGSAAKAVTVLWRWAFDGDADKDTDLGTLPTAPTITVEATVTAQQLSYIEADRLQSKYTFSYYSDIATAFADINGGAVGTNGTGSPAGASVGIYTDENGTPAIVLLADTEVNEALEVQTDMTINLAGYSLKSNANNYAETTALSIPDGYDNVNLLIDGSAPGSTFSAYRDDLSSITLGKFNATSKVTVNGGTYKTHAVDGNATGLQTYGVLTINDADFISIADRVQYSPTGGKEATAAVCVIFETGSFGVAEDCNFDTYAHYFKNSGYNSYGCGIRGLTESVYVLTNCNATGTHTAISSQGTGYFDGGVYEAIGHGGIYFGGKNKTPSTSYARNLITRQGKMPEGYNITSAANQSGFYMGGGAAACNLTVYMDNCEIASTKWQFCLVDTNGEYDNKLYMSNSTLVSLDSDPINPRADSSKNHLYIGSGNNFGYEDLWYRANEGYAGYDDLVTDVATETGEDYSQTIADAIDAIKANIAAGIYEIPVANP